MAPYMVDQAFAIRQQQHRARQQHAAISRRLGKQNAVRSLECPWSNIGMASATMSWR
jgi:hypothetical protein